MMDLLGSGIHDDGAFRRVRGFLTLDVDYYPLAALVLRNPVSKRTEIEYLH